MAAGRATSPLTKPTRLNGNCLGPHAVVEAVAHDHAGPRRDGFSGGIRPGRSGTNAEQVKAEIPCPYAARTLRWAEVNTNAQFNGNA